MKIFGWSDVPLYFVLAILVVILLYKYSTWTHTFFIDQGIPGPKPYPFIGNATDAGFMHHFHEWRQLYGKIYGFFIGLEPVFVISDLDILKEVLVKSFDNFRNRRNFLMVGYPIKLGLFFLENDAWKMVRNIITPTFSGSKLRAMCPGINDSASTLTANFCRALESQKSVNMKQYFGAYTMDVIARTAFGVKVDSQNNLNHPFVSNAKRIFVPSPIRGSLVLLSGYFPFLAKLLHALNFTFFPSDINTFFVENITEMINQRKRNPGEQRVDFLQMLMDAELYETGDGQSRLVSDSRIKSLVKDKQSVKRLTTDEIIGQSIIFFIGGYDTTASTLSFASYNLATHPEVQEKAYQEIKEVLGNEEPDYDNISKLKYLENVILETLRLYPPIISLHRVASETITIKGITIPKGCSVFVPTLSIQRDPEFFQNPEAFKPERHDEKKNPLSFLTFGHGPRICIGMRLALVETKIALVHVLRKVKLETSDDTPSKLTFLPLNLLIPKQPNMLKLSPRDTC